MITVGIINPGPAWETRYLPVFSHLKQRIMVQAVYSPVPSRAQQVAEELHASVSPGLRTLFERKDLRAFLMLGPSWQGLYPLQLACRFKRPLYLAGSVGEDLGGVQQLAEMVQEEGLTLMPEFSRRYTPATARLKELLATCLGDPVHLKLEATLPDELETETVPGQGAGSDFLVGLLDWCWYLMESDVIRVEASADGQRLLMTHVSNAGSEASTVEVFFQQQGLSTQVKLKAICQNGLAEVIGNDTLLWNETNSGTMEETLEADRSEVEVMLDQYCRRAVGGLIPTADLQDVCRQLRVLQAVNESRSCNGPVDLI